MALEFKLPDIGEGIAEGEIVKWHVSVGDQVAEHQTVVEVMTDKATVEIPAPQAGTITDLRAGEGDVVPVGDVIFVLEGGAGGTAAPASSESAPAAESAPARAESASAPAAASNGASGSGGGSVIEFKLPDIGEGIAEGEIVKWHVSEGDEVAEHQTVVEVMTDKATVEIPAPAAGRITKIAAAEGDTVPVGTVIFHLGGAGAAATAAPAAAEPVTAAAPAAASAGSAAPAPAAPRGPAVSLPVGDRETRKPFRGVRRKIAEAMARSKYTATHFTVVEELDVTELVALREKAKAIGAKQDIKVTYMPFIMKAVAQGLFQFPQLNSQLDESTQEVVTYHYVNLGIATDTDNGLIVPVIPDVQSKGVLQLAAELRELADRTRSGKVKPEELKGGTFTITNAGNIGGILATPIINFPEVAILGVHRIVKRPGIVETPEGDEIAVRHYMNLSISVDHRLVDGADAARYLVHLKTLLEDPGLLSL